MIALWNTFYFIIALGILVTIHEYGHFWVARKLGVKVLTFSVGFGKALWQRRGKDGVNYVIAAIPLGGYVKMLDERETDVPPEERKYAFNQKSVWARMAIVLAGPLANFLLAIVFYWAMFAMGITGQSTQMGIIEADSIAGKAGLVENDIVTKVDDEVVFLMQDVVKAVANRIGDKSEKKITVVKHPGGAESELTLALDDWQLDTSRPELLESLGLKHKSRNKVNPPQISSVEAGGAAAKYGIKSGDIVVQFAGETVNNWSEFVSFIQPSANQKKEMIIQRDGELIPISVVIGSREHQGKVVGLLGVSANGYYATRKGGPIESLQLAIAETGKMISLSVNLFLKLITGDISPKSLSGPFSIAEGAGGSARAGLVYFISFVAMISVNLGFINLLPIPLLDGGHFLFFSIEAIKGKPLSEKVQETGMQIGMLMVFALMAIAIFNDLSRL